MAAADLGNNPEKFSGDDCIVFIKNAFPFLDKKYRTIDHPRYHELREVGEFNLDDWNWDASASASARTAPRSRRCAGASRRTQRSRRRQTWRRPSVRRRRSWKRQRAGQHWRAAQVENLQKRLSAADPDTAVFKTWFTAVQEDFRRLEEAAGWVSEKDPEKGDKLAGAVRALLAQQQEAWA
mgnify:CR=1 FL=1